MLQSMREKPMRMSLLGLGAVALIAAGCGAQPTTSTITGTVAQATFPSSIKTIRVFEGVGVLRVVPVAADGSFSLTLPQGAAYRFVFAGGSTETPLVVRSADGRLET